jgi:integrase
MASAEDLGWNIYRLRTGKSAGRLVLQYRVVPGEWKEARIPRKHHTERQAERWALAFIAEFRKKSAARPVLPEADREECPTIRSLANKWGELREGDPKLSAATRVQNASNIQRHVLPYRDIADVPISALGSGSLRMWLRRVRDHGRLMKVKGDKGERPGQGGKWKRTEEPLAPYTTRNVVNTLTAFFDDAMAEQWVDLPANPMRHPGVRKEIPDAITRAGKRVIVHLSRAAAEQLLTSDAVPEQRRVRYLVAATSGARDGELAAVRFDDIDLDAATFNITKSATTKGGATRSDGTKCCGVSIREPKTDASVRVLPLHPLAARALRAWKAQGWARWVGRQPQATALVFPSAGGEPWRPASARYLREDLAAAQLPTLYLGKHPFDFHAFRRSFYTWLRNEGVDRETVEMLMGHSGATVGERHYDDRNLERMRKAVAMLKLDLTRGQLIAIPLRAVSGSDTPPSRTELLTDPLPTLTVSAMAKAQGDHWCARSDSNGRLSASKADALSS